MNEQEIKNIVTNQRKYFYTGATLDVDARLQALKKLRVITNPIKNTQAIFNIKNMPLLLRRSEGCILF